HPRHPPPFPTRRSSDLATSPTRILVQPSRARRPRRSKLGLAEALVDLQALTERLRSDCPWDREQTERTIVPHTVEEAYEVGDDRSEEHTSELQSLRHLV